MDINKIKPIDDLFNSESGYDTPKKINRSTEIVPNEILSEIENGISLETLEKLKFPIDITFKEIDDYLDDIE
jgi:hypothetical protein